MDKKSSRDATHSINGYTYQRWKGVLLILENYNESDIAFQEEGSHEDITVIFGNGKKITYQYKYSQKIFTSKTEFTKTMPLFSEKYKEFINVYFIVGVYDLSNDKKLWPDYLDNNEYAKYSAICEQIKDNKVLTTDKTKKYKYPDLISFDNLTDDIKKKFIEDKVIFKSINETLTNVVNQIQNKILSIWDLENDDQKELKNFYIKYKLYDSFAKNLGKSFKIKSVIDDINDTIKQSNKVDIHLVINESIINIKKSIDDTDDFKIDLIQLYQPLTIWMNDIQSNKLENILSFDNIKDLLSTCYRLYDYAIELKVSFENIETCFKQLQDIIMVRCLNLIKASNKFDIIKQIIDAIRHYNSYKLNGPKRLFKLTKLSSIEKKINSDNSIAEAS